MFLEESPNSSSARRVARLLRRAAHRRGAARPGRGRRGGRRLAGSGAPDRQGRLAGRRVAERVRRPGPAGDRPVHLLRRDATAGAPFPFVTINTVGPTVMRYGTEEQKSFFLPRILAGEVNFAIGYTEPEAGTDLASLRTRAVRDGEEYVVNGAKIFTSGADQADYIWLAVRTDPDAPKHKGISILCVPTTTPGFEWSIINTVGGLTTTQTFYDNVRVPVSNRVGAGERGLAHDHHPAQPRAGGAGRLERPGPLPLRGHRGLGGDPADRRRPDADRPGLGADGSRQVPRRARGDVAPQLAHGGARGGGRAHRRGVVVDQGLRDRAHHRGGAAPVGRGGSGRVPDAGLAGGAAARTPGGDGAPGAGQHVRGWSERGPTRDRGLGGAGHDPGAR